MPSALPSRPTAPLVATTPFVLEGHMADEVAATFGPAPGAVLTITTETVHLKGNRGDFTVPRTALVSIGRGGFYPWCFRGVRFRHAATGLPPRLLFLPLTLSTAALLDRLRALGLPVR